MVLGLTSFGPIFLFSAMHVKRRLNMVMLEAAAKAARWRCGCVFIYLLGEVAVMIKHARLFLDRNLPTVLGFCRDLTSG